MLTRFEFEFVFFSHPNSLITQKLVKKRAVMITDDVIKYAQVRTDIYKRTSPMELVTTRTFHGFVSASDMFLLLLLLLLPCIHLAANAFAELCCL